MRPVMTKLNTTYIKIFGSLGSGGAPTHEELLMSVWFRLTIPSG
eukprot:CAMPEP_0194514806 /NCGR_PEP_ID=MMETSP0253-20130528/47358_1 /TAXON_ID=2966 /ORGANISM="Noctiluca scintillans" /LENGTH=43 /DNA_ID= /DNA_START= /DNA_END= /DNA_ORIENTATION=